MAMGIDEARDDDALRGIDDLSARRADIRLHRRDLLAFDQHVGLLEIADGAVEGEHAAAPDQDRLASGRRGVLARLSVRTADHARERRNRRGAGRRGAKELPPR
jgi:hypothetical protein